MLDHLPERPFDLHRVWRLDASAGTGKTFSLERTILELIEGGVLPDEICYSVFNRAPAETFIEKFYKRGLTYNDMRWWCTSHAMAKRLLKLKSDKILDTDALRKWGDQSGFSLSGSFENDPENAGGWDQDLASLFKKLYEGDDRLTGHESKLLAALKLTEVVEGKYTHVRYLVKALQMRLVPPGIKYLLIDEAQDLSKVQFDWVRYIVDNCPHVQGIMIAGDAKQSVNAFKGADPELFLGFQAEETVFLPVTYRMAPEILKEANSIIEPVKRRSDLVKTSARNLPGVIITTPDFQDLYLDIEDWLRERKSVLILARNRCWLQYAAKFLDLEGLPVRKEWHERHKRVRLALLKIRLTRMITEDSYACLLPSFSPQKGELQKKAFWERGVVEKLRKGGFKDEPALLAGYTSLRYGGGVNLEDCETIGLSTTFREAIEKWDILADLWTVSQEELEVFNTIVDRFGWDFPEIRLSTIHASKGEEADAVVLLSNITTRTELSEQEDEDSERRCWYVGATRARDILALTKIKTFNKITRIL